MIIAVDFDGTLVSNAYPNIGRPLDGGKNALKMFRTMGHTVIINTSRQGAQALKALGFLNINDYEFDLFNESDPGLIAQYGDTRKIFADIYIDDHNIGGFPGWEWAVSAVQAKTFQKPLIIAIVGESGSGKTEMAKYLEGKYAVKLLESYTDRPRRTPDEEGHTFISRDEFAKIKRQDKIAASSYGEYNYCCTHNDVEDICTYVINEHGLEQLIQYDDKYNIVTVRVTAAPIVIAGRIDSSRIARDVGQFIMPYDFFEYHLHNDYTIDHFYKLIDKMYSNLMHKHRPFTHVFRSDQPYTHL